MVHAKVAQTHYPIQENLAKRWSPYSFADKDIDMEDLLAILEAARWAASSYNEQPWRYLLARRSEPEAFARLLSCLAEANQAWAKNAPVLLVGCVKTNFSRNGKPNKAAYHDLGLAAGNLCVEATARGLYVHQMIGIEPERVRQLYQLPADAEAVTALAIGYLGDSRNLSEDLQARDKAKRSRHPIQQFVFENVWDEPLRIGKA